MESKSENSGWTGLDLSYICVVNVGELKN
jgi:hypothetical protein